MESILVNGKAFDYTQITCIVAGVPLAGISAINYITEQEKVNNFGTGKYVVSRGRGPQDTTGSLEISMNDVEKIRAKAPGGNLLDIPAFDIIIVFGNVTSPKTHVVKNVEFNSDGVETSQGDTDIRRTFDFVASHVKYR